MEAFPKLKDTGGYELLRASNGRVLEVVPVPPEGYSAAYLKDVMQQAKIYIRPIQKSLSIDVNTSEMVCANNYSGNITFSCSLVRRRSA